MRLSKILQLGGQIVVVNTCQRTIPSGQHLVVILWYHTVTKDKNMKMQAPRRDFCVVVSKSWCGINREDLYDTRIRLKDPRDIDHQDSKRTV